MPPPLVASSVRESAVAVELSLAAKRNQGSAQISVECSPTVCSSVLTTVRWNSIRVYAPLFDSRVSTAWTDNGSDSPSSPVTSNKPNHPLQKKNSLWTVLICLTLHPLSSTAELLVDHFCVLSDIRRSVSQSSNSVGTETLAFVTPKWRQEWP